jgi:hypothetical protein
MIYDYVIAMELDELDTTASLALFEAIDEVDNFIRPGSLNPAHPLHHVSKAIRGEFLPLRPVQLNSTHFKRYLRILYPKYTADLRPFDLSRYSGNIVFNFEEYDRSINILPAIRLVASSSSFRFQIGRHKKSRHHAAQIKQLNESLSSVRDTWKLLSLGRITYLTVDPKGLDIEVTVAAGIRELMLWPDSMEMFDGHSLSSRLGLLRKSPDDEEQHWTTTIHRLKWRSLDYHERPHPTQW